MKNVIVAAAVAAAIAAPLSAQAKVSSKWFGFSQITAMSGGGGANDGLTFGADRVRIGYKLKDGNVYGGLQLDFNRKHETAKTGTLNEVIKDAYAGYKVNSALNVKLGQFKTPIGMDFNTSGKKLDITKRGMEKGLVLERAAGAQISGKLGGGLSYAAFYGNPAGRSSAFGNGTVGSDNSWAVRVAYDMGKSLHLEASTGATEDSAGKDYTVWDVAAKWKSGPLTVKFEYIDGENVKNTDGRNQTVWYLHGGYRLNKMLELVARYYDGESDNGGKTQQSNTYLGANIFLGSTDQNGRLQVNYVLADGDGAAYTGVGTTYTDDIFLVQYQVSF